MSWAKRFTGTALAKSLVGTLPYDFEFSRPEEKEFLERLGCEGYTGHPLMEFVADGGIAPVQALRGGVAAIAAMADLSPPRPGATSPRSVTLPW